MTDTIGSSSSLPSTRAGYRDIPVYAPPIDVIPIELGDNTNRWGAPPAAVREMRAADPNSASRYPNAYAETLRSALAEYVDADESMIVTGCGSDDVLDCTMRAFGEAGDEVIGLAPSFVMVPSFARLNGLRYTPVPLRADYSVDRDAMVRSDARIRYLCSPNNPTGTPIDRATIEAVLDSAGGILIVDEAYTEFAGETVADLAAAHPRLVIARTLSKAFGLAGLRIGYGVAAPSTIREIEKARGPYKIAAIAERAATAAVVEDESWMRDRVRAAIASRERLAGLLESRGIGTAPSATNFLFAPLYNAVAIAREMRTLGVSVRAFDGLPRFTSALESSDGAALRVTVGPDHEVDACIAALDEARRRCG